MKIAIISRDQSYAHMLELELRRRGLNAVRSDGFGDADAALLDLDRTGSTLVREGENAVPTLTFSLEEGRADFLRPFSIDALVLALDALCAKKQLTSAPMPVLDPRRRRVFYKGADASLSPLECSLFAMLLETPGTPIPHDRLQTAFAGRGGDEMNRLRVSINALRTKLKKAFGTQMITSVRGEGYALSL